MLYNKNKFYSISNSNSNFQEHINGCKFFDFFGFLVQFILGILVLFILISK
jgi:hypothetical protein